MEVNMSENNNIQERQVELYKNPTNKKSLHTDILGSVGERNV